MANKHLGVRGNQEQQSTLGLPRKLGRKSAAYLAKNYKYLQKDPRFFVMKTVARFEFARDWATRNAPSAFDHNTVVASNVMSAEQDIGQVVSTLRTDGYYVGLQLSPNALDSFLKHCQASPCFADRDPNLKLHIKDRKTLEQRLGRPIKLASYFKQQEEWPVFRSLLEDPMLQAIATAYLGRTPVYVRSELAWSFPYDASVADKRTAAQVLHCDINDYRTIKFFFYLTEVGPQNGPHAYIKKSPRTRSPLHQLLGQHCASISESDLILKYDNQLVSVCGPAGWGFAGDPYYFHRGTTPINGERLLLQVEFGCHKYRTWYFDV